MLFDTTNCHKFVQSKAPLYASGTQALNGVEKN
jgi:hypothetical protein